MFKKITKITTVSLALSIALTAGEMRYGKGTFDMSMGVDKLFTMDMGLDIDVLTLSEHHANFSNYPIYYFYNADFYSSDFIDKMT